MSEKPVSVMVEELPAEAQCWVKRLSPAARIEIDRLLRETRVEAFTTFWREHKAELEELEKSYDTRI